MYTNAYAAYICTHLQTYTPAFAQWTSQGQILRSFALPRLDKDHTDGVTWLATVTYQLRRWFSRVHCLVVYGADLRIMSTQQWYRNNGLYNNYHLTLSNIGCLRLKHPQSSKARMDQMHDRKSESVPDVTAWSNRSYQMSHSRRKYAVAQRSNDGLSIERALGSNLRLFRRLYIFVLSTTPQSTHPYKC